MLRVLFVLLCGIMFGNVVAGMVFDTNEEPIIPFAAITGRPTKEFLTKRLEEYRNVGITQFMIYARTGLEVEYMSDEWLDMCEHICKEAKRLGFTSVWLYDEYNWPSGTCNKRVMQENPDHALTQLSLYKDSQSGELKFAIRKSKVVSDLLNPQAVESFMRLTHYKYEQRLKPYFGSLVKGIFTDEPEIGWFDRRREDVAVVAWYDTLEEDYKKACGSDLRSDMIAGYKSGSKFYEKTCRKLLAKRFKETFVDKIVSWADKHGMVFTGHLMDEYDTDGAQSKNGHILEVLSAFSFPGIDDIFTQETMEEQEWITLTTGMYAIEKRGNKGGLAELFALGSSDLTITEMLRQFYLVSCFGVTHYTCLAPLDARGSILKNLYYSTISQTQSWFAKYPEFIVEAKRAAAFGVKERECNIAIRYPYETTHIPELLHQLAKKQYQWKFVLPDEETDAPVVISLEDGKIIEEHSRNNFIFNLAAFEKAVLSKMDLRSATVETKDGALVEDVFVRTFKNCEVVVLDYSGSTRDLVLNRKGVKSSFRLYAKGVKCFPGWKVEIEKPNTLRADFIDGKFTFYVKEPLTDVKLLVRNYGPEVKLTFDGKEVNGTKSTTDLPHGYDTLYLETEPFNLSPGEHTLEWVNKGNTHESPYLSEAIFTGKFASNLGREVQTFVGHAVAERIEQKPMPYLSVYKNDGVGLWGYVSPLAQEADLIIPRDALKVSFDTAGLVAELFVNGKSLGTNVTYPFTWILPHGIQGKSVKMKLVRYLSCGRLYGETVFERVWKECGRQDKRRWLPNHKPNNSKPLAPFCEAFFE